MQFCSNLIKYFDPDSLPNPITSHCAPLVERSLSANSREKTTHRDGRSYNLQSFRLNLIAIYFPIFLYPILIFPVASAPSSLHPNHPDDIEQPFSFGLRFFLPQFPSPLVGDPQLFPPPLMEHIKFSYNCSFCYA